MISKSSLHLLYQITGENIELYLTQDKRNLIWQRKQTYILKHIDFLNPHTQRHINVYVYLIKFFSGFVYENINT